MTTKKWISAAIIAVVVVGALALIKLFPFWVTLSCLISLAGGLIAGYLLKDKVETVVNMVDSTEVINSIKDWFSSLPASEISKAASVVKKTKTTAAKTGK